MTTNFTATSAADFDGDVNDITGGPDSAANTIYTIGLSTSFTINNEFLTLPSGSSLEIDGPEPLVVAAGQGLFAATAQNGTTGTLTLDTGVSGGAYTEMAAAATIVLGGVVLVNGSAASEHSGANQMLAGSVYGQSAMDSVDNFGQIEVSAATSTAVYLTLGGTVTNETAGTIQADEYGVRAGGTTTVVNLGTITATDGSGPLPAGTSAIGIALGSGGTVYNGLTTGFAPVPTAVASGIDDGVLVQGASGLILNSGTISGNVAITFNGVAGQVNDNGAITSTAGVAGTAIQFGTGTSSLELGPGFTITGKVEGGTGAGAATTLDMTSGTGNFTNGMTVGTGEFSGLAANSGTATTSSTTTLGTVSNSFGFDNIQTIDIDSGATFGFSGVNAATNLQLGGEADVAANGSLEITGAATGTGTISLGADAGLAIDTAAAFGSGQGVSYTGDVIAQFATGNSIDLKDVSFASLTMPSFTNNQLQLSDGTHTADLNFASASGFTGLPNFTFAQDSGTGTLITVACYCPGTLIATPAGEVPVEELEIGDLVSTIDGRVKPVLWIGQRTYAGRFVVANPKVQPIRFRAGSLGEGLPRRDLLVSPEHAMHLDGVLIPARCLVDGVGIVRERGWTRVEYIHIELESHDLILAEGAASETFIDDGSRVMFQNADEYAELYPDAPTAAAFCAPRVEDGYELEAIRQRLALLSERYARAA